MMNDPEVLIVGVGPVGLTPALLAKPADTKDVPHSVAWNGCAAVTVMFAVLLGFGYSQQVRAEVIDDRPYPLLEFFLAHECIERDVEVTTLIQDLGRFADSPRADLRRAYRAVSEARIACAVGRVAQSLAVYDAAGAILCASKEQLTSSIWGGLRAQALRPSLCNDSNASASATGQKEK